jgi:internalin A
MGLPRTCGAALGLRAGATTPTFSPAQDNAAEPSAAVLAAWRKAGAADGVTFVNRWHHFEFHPGERPSGGRLPAFKFTKPPAQPFKDLPAPKGPFAVHLSGDWVTGDHLKELAAFEQLQTLDVFTNLKEVDVRPLAGYANLQALALNTWTTDAHAKDLAKLRTLRVFNASNTRLTDAGLKELAALPRLETLALPWQVTNAGLKELAAFPSLQSLAITTERVTDAGLKELAALRHLQTLRLNYAMTGAGLKALAGLKGLRTLDSGGSPSGGATAFNDAALKELAALPQLETLYLQWAKVSDAGMKELAALPKLHTLDLYGCEITDKGVKELAAVPQLRHLGLCSNRWITKQALNELKAFKQLQSVNLRYVTGVTDFEIAVLRQAMPKLETIR